MSALRVSLVVLSIACAGGARGEEAKRWAAPAPATADWPVTEGAPGGGRYTPLADITRANVKQLRVAWTHRHGDFFAGDFPLRQNRGSAFESTPIVVDGRLFFTTPRNRVIALDPETGRELWAFDPQLARGRAYANMWINRGVAYWRDAAARGACAARVFLATLDARLIALDAATGKPCAGFGASGSVNLREGIARSSTRGSTTSRLPARLLGT